jgi:hypothetical protein
MYYVFTHGSNRDVAIDTNPERYIRPTVYMKAQTRERALELAKIFTYAMPNGNQVAVVNSAL